MDVPADHARMLRAYLDARLVCSYHLDDPNPVTGAWAAERSLKYMLIRRGWTEERLDRVFARYERTRLRRLDAEGWRCRLAEALMQSTDRSLRVSQAVARYREKTGGLTD